MKHIQVAAAIIVEQGRVFAARRNNTGELALKWEFPGGKLEPGESGETAIVREILEELSVKVEVECHVMTVYHQYHTCAVTMEAYLCAVMDGNIQLTEHVEGRWLRADQLYTVDWAAADMPIVEALVSMLQSENS